MRACVSEESFILLAVRYAPPPKVINANILTGDQCRPRPLYIFFLLLLIRKYRDLDIGPSSSNARCKYKRLQHLEGILQKLKPNEHEPIVLDPESILACRYLRLSKSNVESLEKMLMDMGKEPQIHVHKYEPIESVFADYRPATSSTATDDA